MNKVVIHKCSTGSPWQDVHAGLRRVYCNPNPNNLIHSE